MNILVVDDEANIRKTLTVCLETRGHRVTAVGSPKDAQEEAALQVFDLAFVDLRLGTESGMDLISVLLAAYPWLKIVIITAYAFIDTADEAIRRGATDYIPKPFKPDQVVLVTERIATLHAMEQRISGLQEDLERVHPEILYKSDHPGMQRAIELARQVAPSEAVVMLRGPSGTDRRHLTHLEPEPPVAHGLRWHHDFGFLTSLDLGRRAILEYDYYLDHADPGERGKVARALPALDAWLEEMTRRVPGFVSMKDVFGQGFSRKESFLYRV